MVSPMADATRADTTPSVATPVVDHVPYLLPQVHIKALSEGTAGAVVLAHLAQHLSKIETNDPLVRADAEDAVHQMRVATRRLRSALTTFRPLFDRGVTDPQREELRWLCEVLGAARDAEVIRDHLCGMLHQLPAEQVRGPVERRIVGTMTHRYRAAHAAVLVELDGIRYGALVSGMAHLLADPPLTHRAGHMAAIQEDLGTYQDTVVIRGEIRSLVLGALENFENAFTYGRLDALERARAVQAEADYAGAWEAASQPSLSAWLHAGD